MDRRFVFHLWGDSALFVNPHFRADPYSYAAPSPSGLKGLLKAIFWKPEFEWEILRIHVMNAIRYTSQPFAGIKEVKRTSAVSETLQWNTVLRHVEYFVECRRVLNPYRDRRDNYPEMLRRFRQGQQRSQPYFGRAECAASWELWEKPIPTALPIDLELGSLLFDLVPIDISRDRWESVFFPARLEQGVLHVPQELYDKHRDHRFISRNAAHPHRRR